MTPGAPRARLGALLEELRALKSELRAAREEELASFDEPLPVLLLEAAQRALALPARSLVEVVPRVELAEPPSGAGGLAGLMQYRGVSVPVLDAGALWSGVASPVRLDQRIAVVDSDEAWRGVLVDRAEALHTVTRAELAAVPSDVSGSEWCVAMFRSEGRPVLLLSLHALRDLLPA